MAFDVAHGRGGGAADDSGLAVIEFDGQGGVGDVDGDGLVLVDPAEGDLCLQTMITPVFDARR